MRRFLKIVGYMILGMAGTIFAFWLYIEHPDRLSLMIGVGFAIWFGYHVINDLIVRPLGGRLSALSRQLDDCQNRLDRIERRQIGKNF